MLQNRAHQLSLPKSALDTRRNILMNSIIENPARNDITRYVHRSLDVNILLNIAVLAATIRNVAIGTPITGRNTYHGHHFFIS